MEWKVGKEWRMESEKMKRSLVVELESSLVVEL